MEGAEYALEKEEEEEEEEEEVAPRASGTHSCSSLIRLEQEAKRRKRAQLQQQQHRLSTIMPAKYSSDNVLDLAEYTRKQPWWRKLFGASSGSSEEKYSVATQLALGGVTGWCTGFIFQKIGKLAATAVGGGFFLLQIFSPRAQRAIAKRGLVIQLAQRVSASIYEVQVANHTGYIKIDWQMVERDVNKARQQLKFSGNTSKRLDPNVKSKMGELASFLKKNVLLSGGFVGGFLLGMAS